MHARLPGVALLLTSWQSVELGGSAGGVGEPVPTLCGRLLRYPRLQMDRVHLRAWERMIHRCLPLVADRHDQFCPIARSVVLAVCLGSRDSRFMVDVCRVFDQITCREQFVRVFSSFQSAVVDYIGLPTGPTEAEVARTKYQLEGGKAQQSRRARASQDDSENPHNANGFGITRGAFREAQREHGHYQIQSLNTVMKSESGCFANWEARVAASGRCFARAKLAVEGTQTVDGRVQIPWARMARMVNTQLPAVNNLFSLHSCSCFHAIGLCMREEDNEVCVPPDECKGSWDLYVWAYPHGTRATFWEWMQQLAIKTRQSILAVENQLCKVKCACLGSKPYGASAAHLVRMLDAGYQCAGEQDPDSPAAMPTRKVWRT